MQLNCKSVQLSYIKLINRKIETEIHRLIEFYPVITITGPRQSGKTTLCRNMFPDFFALLEKVIQFLAGRTAVLTLLPLSLHELGDRIDGLSADTLMLNGCYPAFGLRIFLVKTSTRIIIPLILKGI